MAKRAGKTVKISVSIDKNDLALLRHQAEIAHGGNLSAALAEAVDFLRKREARRRLIEMLGGCELSPERAAEIDAEQAGRNKPSRGSTKNGRKRRAA